MPKKSGPISYLGLQYKTSYADIIHHNIGSVSATPVIIFSPLSLGSESDVAGGDSVTLVVGDNLNTSVLEHSNTKYIKLISKKIKDLKI